MGMVMARKKWFLVWIFLMISVGILYHWYHDILETSTLPTTNKVIVVDAGHGGIDGGAVGKSGILESHVNLEIALRLRKLLEQSGALVILTRDADIGLYSDSGRIRDKKNEDLKNRKKIMDESDADIFVSIHLNSFPQPQYYGAQTFYPQNSEKSKMLAEFIQEELIRVLNNGNTRKSKLKSDVYLMQESSIPLVLVECGFLSNPMEERLLQEPKYQEKVAWSIYIGILRYFHEVEG
ncbi:N-acetylmuramoyl-L-alanine amidase CwlD [Thermotalea metallivorans]|uniref:Germination-specific N-acetylmuramoyl-L-alanine amidase n=1 Tax=Thermotalea metallivorans TaxID=520762 RepID=A0A140L2G8_9FIRM|nr:N-acetylmuramoyl-L-alanine amidase CwlD [Thermotalea metallivorans]KXG74743.1 Germination-specific N-acetylmuramoyl-L-alanine amidase [Thermotalea metallivorans]